MITKVEIALLRGLTKNNPEVFKLEAEEKVLLYAKWFVLDLPRGVLDPTFNTWSEVNDLVVTWRDRLPSGEGAYGQAVRWTNPEDGTTLIRLISDFGVAIIHSSIYDVVTKQMPEPEFRVFEGDKLPVAILSMGAVIGGTAQVKV
jgi:hypothetical protein